MCSDTFAHPRLGGLAANVPRLRYKIWICCLKCVQCIAKIKELVLYKDSVHVCVSCAVLCVFGLNHKMVTLQGRLLRTG